MKQLRTAILMLILIISSTQAESYWDRDDDKPYFQQRDNLAHITVSTLISGATSSYARSQGFSEAESIGLGILTAVLVGTAKELSDKNFSREDLSGYLVGGVIGSTFVVYTF